MDTLLQVLGGATSSQNWGYGIALNKNHRNSSIKNSVVVNAGGDSILSYGDHNLIENNKVFATWNDEDGNLRTNNPDYDITIRGDFNIIKNNYIKTDPTLDHRGHGLSVVTDKNGNWIYGTVVEYDSAEYNEIYNNTIIGTGHGLELRDGVSNNIYRNNITINCGYGIFLQDGAINNEIYDTTMENITGSAIVYFEGIENGQGEISYPNDNNIIDGLNITNTRFFIEVSENQTDSRLNGEKLELEVTNNIVKNVSIDEVTDKVFHLNGTDLEDVISNNSVKNIIFTTPLTSNRISLIRGWTIDSSYFLDIPISVNIIAIENSNDITITVTGIFPTETTAYVALNLDGDTETGYRGYDIDLPYNSNIRQWGNLESDGYNTITNGATVTINDDIATFIIPKDYIKRKDGTSIDIIKDVHNQIAVFMTKDDKDSGYIYTILE